MRQQGDPGGCGRWWVVGTADRRASQWWTDPARRGKGWLSCGISARVEHVFDTDLLPLAAEFRALGSRIAGLLTAEVSGAVAAEVLADVLAGVRAGELATCRAIERVDRTGEFATDGAASTAAY